MTKVMRPMDKVASVAFTLLLAASVFCSAQDQPETPAVGESIPGSTVATNAAEKLFLDIGSVGLDPSRVYSARNLSFDRPGFSITLDHGTIGFTADVAGRVTGAFFEGDGEVLLIPPNQVERGSMALFTGAAILEEHFTTGYFRFNDNTFAESQPYLAPADDAADFLTRWKDTAHNLAQIDGLRIFMSFSRFLPVAGAPSALLSADLPSDDRFLHARLQGQKQGIFDVYYDARSTEQVWTGQFRTTEGYEFYDVWSSFALPGNKPASTATTETVATQEGRSDALEITDVKIKAEIKPPTVLDADAELRIHVLKGGQRAAVFELARTLVVKEVDADGQPAEFIHNPAIEGTQLSKRGNDVVAVVFPKPIEAGQTIRLRFVYGGEVLSAAGPGLLLVGARGTWYPNRGIAMANFDLEFRYPAGWTLVATGKRVDAASGTTDMNAEQASHWVSERPLPIAGFNLGKYQRVTAQAGDVTVAAYATQSMEKGFPQQQTEEIVPEIGGIAAPIVVVPAPPSPARNAQRVAQTSAHAIDVYSREFGPYPFHELSLTQKPGNLSQGWPGLIFLSSLSFLTPEEESNLHMSQVEKALISEVISHETAHQWWGDLVMWNGYRDQWTSEALANYSSLMLFESDQPAEFRAIMNEYRGGLLLKNKAGVQLMQVGPVTLGTRLSCSIFPEGYEAISYGRGTWLFYMLRHMMLDAEKEKSSGEPDPFIRALRKLRERYEGKSVTTRQMLQVFEEELPRSMWYEGHRSLDWFYDGWINGTAVPRYELKNVKYVDKPDGTAVSGVLVQKDAPDKLITPVPLYSSRTGKTTFLGRVFADGPETSFHLNAPTGTHKIVIDPEQTVLARIH